MNKKIKVLSHEICDEKCTAKYRPITRVKTTFVGEDGIVYKRVKMRTMIKTFVFEERDNTLLFTSVKDLTLEEIQEVLTEREERFKKIIL